MTAVEIAARPSDLGVTVVETAAARALVVRLHGPHDLLSWAIVNGGRTKTDVVVWREVRLAELGPTVDAGALLRETLAQVDAPGAVGLLTARDIRRHETERAARDGIQAECLATVGLGNLLAVGDPTTALRSPVGTINLLCRVSVGLTEEALLEASAIAAEARTAAVLAAGLRSPLSGRPATGTGTDCIVIAAPATARPDRFAGKHTACGSAMGAAVFGAVSRGVARWLEENACPAR
ncbi:MAG TPA: adenosylcobinamide amidohydrolase [Polyangia bacterium]|nr:adenosylcobinamide amidohydrolase [Polyangia bacterium]